MDKIINDRKIRFNFEATGVGSVPFREAKEACRIIFDSFREIPFWPQLPKRSYLENMYIQYSEGLPGAVIDGANKTIHIDAIKAGREMENVYSKYLEGDLEFFGISKDRAEGLYEFLDRLKAPPKFMRFAKGQITGPVSYGLFLTDQDKKSVIYDKDLFEALAKTLVMKAKWQIRKIKKLFRDVIIFIDEPYLVSIGSSFVNVNMEDAVNKLDELIDAIKGEGALAGIHCCGNTDWSVLLKRDIDILNFDAYNFIKEFSLYSDDLKNFLQKGGTIAWGIVPSSDAVGKENAHTLAAKLRSAFDLLKDKAVTGDRISSLVTPSCGVGSLDEKTALDIFKISQGLSKAMQK